MKILAEDTAARPRLSKTPQNLQINLTPQHRKIIRPRQRPHRSVNVIPLGANSDRRTTGAGSFIASSCSSASATRILITASALLRYATETDTLTLVLGSLAVQFNISFVTNCELGTIKIALSYFLIHELRVPTRTTSPVLSPNSIRSPSRIGCSTSKMQNDARHNVAYQRLQAEPHAEPKRPAQQQRRLQIDPLDMDPDQDADSIDQKSDNTRNDVLEMLPTVGC
jgi:hypothetical protein